MRNKNWIYKAIGKDRGALHRSLGIPLKEKIGHARTAAAAKRKGKVGRRARLALTLEKLRRH